MLSVILIIDAFNHVSFESICSSGFELQWLRGSESRYCRASRSLLFERYLSNRRGLWSKAFADACTCSFHGSSIKQLQFQCLACIEHRHRAGSKGFALHLLCGMRSLACLQLSDILAYRLNTTEEVQRQRHVPQLTYCGNHRTEPRHVVFANAENPQPGNLLW